VLFFWAIAANSMQGMGVLLENFQALPMRFSSTIPSHQDTCTCKVSAASLTFFDNLKPSVSFSVGGIDDHGIVCECIPY